MDVWIWVAVGLVLIITEMVVPTFFLMFLGIGALIVAGLTMLGLTTGIETQLALFAITSTVLLLLLRGRFKSRISAKEMPPDYLGQIAIVTETIVPGREGKIFYRGSTWIAVSDTEIQKDATVTIVAREGICLRVKPA